MITMAGMIGAGKSSMTSILAHQLGTKAYFEPVSDNPVLPLFYKGNEIAAKKRAEGDKDATNPYAYLLQTFFLNRRFAMIKKAMRDDNNILDRSIYEDALFMKMNTDMGNATKVEYDIYHSLLKNMLEELPYAAHKKAPDLMVIIQVSYDTVIKRIKRRGRKYEQVSADPSLEGYYKRLIRYYDEWKHEYKASPLLVIDGDRYDFMTNISDRRHVLDQIYRELHKIGSLDDQRFTELEDKLPQLKLMTQPTVSNTHKYTKRPPDEPSSRSGLYLYCIFCLSQRAHWVPWLQNDWGLIFVLLQFIR